MLIPYRPDAPLKHWPIVTIVMIVLNTVIYVVTVAAGPEATEPYMLEFGNGYHPVQWVTGNFLHGGPLHLIGNMIFLWTFGMLIEGKLGWWKYLLVFMGIGVMQNIVQQTVTLWMEEGHSLGASAIIYGLMAMCLLWMPRSQVRCFLFLGVWIIWFAAETYVLVGVMLIGEAFTSFLLNGLTLGLGMGLAVTSELLHLIGGGVGFAVGFAMLALRMVDCEKWDLFSILLRGDFESRAPSVEREAQRKIRREQQQEESAAALEQARHYIASGRLEMAENFIRRTKQTFVDWRLPESDLIQLISAYHKQSKLAESIPSMLEYLRHYNAKANLVRLKLADILVQHEKRGGAALKVMTRIDRNSLAPKQQAYFDQLRRRAEQLREEDPFEVVDDW